jgi:hypothetical protein
MRSTILQNSVATSQIRCTTNRSSMRRGNRAEDELKTLIIAVKM